MDKEFKRKSDAVFAALGILAKAEPDIVFLGGSAIQAILGKQRRLSIDLDISANQDAKHLANSLQTAGYSIVMRQSKNPIFEFCKVSKDGVDIKLDISKFAIDKTERQTLGGISVLTPSKHYFLAAKLSSLALGTVGRQEHDPTQVIKDVFDINCLLDEKIAIDGMPEDWNSIVSDQNHLRNTQHNEVDCAVSVQQTLLKCLPIASPSFITPNVLRNFEALLVSGRLLRPEFVAMSARALLLLANMDDSFYKIDAQISADAADRQKLSEAEKELLKTGLPPALLHGLKINAPNALLYALHWSRKKRGDNKISNPI